MVLNNLVILGQAVYRTPILWNEVTAQADYHPWKKNNANNMNDLGDLFVTIFAFGIRGLGQ